MGDSVFYPWRNPISGRDDHNRAYAGVCQGFCQADNEQIMQDAVTRILATIISAMGQQAGGYVAVPAMMQMQGMNVAPVPSVTPADPTESRKETVEELPENNLELSDKPLDDGALASLSAMFGDDEED